jgi:predicted nuclease with TOPRIM domain
VAYNTVREKVNRTNSELSNVSIAVRKLRSAQSECNNLINELKDKIESSEATSADVFVSNSDSFFNDTALAFFISRNNASYKPNFFILAKRSYGIGKEASTGE